MTAVKKTRRNAHFGSLPLLWGGPPALPAASRHGGEGRGGGQRGEKGPRGWEWEGDAVPAPLSAVA